MEKKRTVEFILIVTGCLTMCERIVFYEWYVKRKLKRTKMLFF